MGLCDVHHPPLQKLQYYLSIIRNANHISFILYQLQFLELIIYTLQVARDMVMEALRASETSVSIYQSTRSNSPEHSHLHV
jgi:hypothetical protein